MAAPKAGRRFQPSKVRVAVIGLVVVAAWMGMGYRLVQIQVVQASDLAEQGLSQRLVSRDLAPQRGKIFDRNGELLAMTVQAQSIFAVPDQIEEPLWVAQQIGGLLGADTDVLYERLTSDRDFVYIKRQVEDVVANEVLGLEIRGVYSHPEPTRIYPAGVVASRVTGFVNIDGDGQEGLELVYDDGLAGTPGKAEFERDLQGRVIPQGFSQIVPAIPGVDLNTTIDLPLQYQAQQECLLALEQTHALSCWVVVLEVETERPRRAQHALRDSHIVKSVTQLGTRLHVMVDRQTEDPVALVRQTLADAGIPASIEIIPANLEDVFVAATGFAHG